MRADSTEIRRDVEALRRASRDENLDIRVIQLAVHEWLSQIGTAFPLRSRLEQELMTRSLTPTPVSIRRIMLYDLPSDLYGIRVADRQPEQSHRYLNEMLQTWYAQVLRNMAAVGMRRGVGVGSANVYYETRVYVLGPAAPKGAQEVDNLPDDAVILERNDPRGDQFESLWSRSARSYTRASPIEGIPASDLGPTVIPH